MVGAGIDANKRAIDTAQTVHDVLRTFEIAAPSDAEDPDADPATGQRARAFLRLRGCTPAMLHGLLRSRVPPIPETRARIGVRDAVASGLLVKHGAGSATKYRTAQYEEDVRHHREQQSRSLTRLGQRAEALGLTVSYRLGDYIRVNHSSALPPLLSKGYLVRSLELTSPLEDVVTLVETAQEGSSPRGGPVRG